MGLQDRDYYRDKCAAKRGGSSDVRLTSTPHPGAGRSSTGWLWLLLMGMGLLSFAAISLPSPWGKRTRPSAPAPPLPSPSLARVPDTQPVPVTPPPPAAAALRRMPDAQLAAPPAAQVYRCGNAYSHMPCAGGVAVDTSPAVSNPAGPSSTQIHLCQATDGRAYWIPQQCAVRGWTWVRSAWVSAHLSWEEQLQSIQPPALPAPSRQSAPVPTVRGTQRAAVSRQVQCEQLDARVAQLDRMGRAGSLHHDLDGVREQRRQARDLQFRLRC